jgi:hypothetical protein
LDFLAPKSLREAVEMKGRPRRKAIDFLFTKIWFEMSSRAAGGWTPYKFWKEIDQSRGDKSDWERHKRGKRVPENKAGRERVARVEARFPGTARILNSPALHILKGTKPSSDNVKMAIRDVGDPFNRILLEGGYEENDGDRETERVFQELSLFPSFKLVETVILLLAWADDLGLSEFWNYICHFYRFMIPELIRSGNIPFHEELFDAVDQLAQVREFKSTNQREDVFQSWRETRPERDLKSEKVRREMIAFFDSV